MATAADELYNDFEDSDSEEIDEETEKPDVPEPKDVTDEAPKLQLDNDVQPVLKEIQRFQSIPAERRELGNFEDNAEYKLVTQANSLSSSIGDEIVRVHKVVRDHYSTRFPELETLVIDPLDYAKTVAVLGNGPFEDVKSTASSAENAVGQPLDKILDGPSLMVVNIEAASTKGRPLNESELHTVMRACKMVLSLEQSKKILTDYVQSRMSIFAPNLTALIGSQTAARLINHAGGITGLAKTPACNITSLGSKKQSGTGFATNVGIRQQGFLFHSPVIQFVPYEFKKKAMRVLSNKIVLVARSDQLHESSSGSRGEALRLECEERFEKLQEAPHNQGTRALPAPDDKPARKRGGWRARSAKAAVGMTEMRKQQNRMAFGQEEKEVGFGTGEFTKGLGMLGQENRGKIRSEQIDQRTRAKLSKKNPGWGGTATSINSGTTSSLRSFGSGAPGNASTLRAQGLRTSGVGAGAGTASSIAFTPAQGLELVDPKVQAELNRKRKAEDDRWFKGGTFTQAGSQSNGNPTVNGGFKVPQLPQKRVDNGASKTEPPPLTKVSGS